MLRAFTLVELLVVIAIISVLAGLILPVLEESIEMARRIQCLSQVRQIHMAATTYATESDNFVPAGGGHPAFWKEYHTLKYSELRLLWDLEYLPDTEIMRCPSRTDAYLQSINPGASPYVENKKWELFYSCYTWAGSHLVSWRPSGPWLTGVYYVRMDLHEPDFTLMADMLPNQPNTCSWRQLHYANHPVEGGNAVCADGSGEWVPYGDRWVNATYRLCWVDEEEQPGCRQEYWFTAPAENPSGPRRGRWFPYF